MHIMKKKCTELVLGGLFCLLISCTYHHSTPIQGTDSDSIYTLEYIVKIHIKEPQRALGLIDTAFMRGFFRDYQADELRAVVYQAGLNDLHRAMEYCLRIYQLDSIRLIPSRNVSLLRRMCGISYGLGNYGDCIRYATEGIPVAQSLGKPNTEGLFLFDIGQSMMRLGQKKEAWEYMERSVATLEKAEDTRALPYLSYFYGTQMSFLIENKEIAKAIEVGEKRKELIARIEKECRTPQQYVDQQYGYLYSKLAYLYVLSGDRQKADGYAADFLKTEFSQSSEGISELLNYYKETSQYQKMIGVCNKMYLLPQGQDTISLSFVAGLQHWETAHEKLGNMKAALTLQKRIGVIEDSLFQRERQDKALKLATIYRTHEKDIQLKESEAKLQRNRILGGTLAGLLLIMGVLLWNSYRHSRIASRKNKVLVRQLNKLDSCQAQLNAANERIRLLSVRVKQERVGEPVATPENEINRQLFERLESIMEKEKLYLQPKLSREDVMQCLHIGKARLAQIIQENTEGGNLNIYLTNLRLNHALHLLRTRPDYTIQAIAEDSGIANIRTFQRLFKERLGMTPMEYRRAVHL